MYEYTCEECGEVISADSYHLYRHRRVHHRHTTY